MRPPSAGAVTRLVQRAPGLGFGKPNTSTVNEKWVNSANVDEFYNIIRAELLDAGIAVLNPESQTNADGTYLVGKSEILAGKARNLMTADQTSVSGKGADKTRHDYVVLAGQSTYKQSNASSTRLSLMAGSTAEGGAFGRPSSSKAKAFQPVSRMLRGSSVRRCTRDRRGAWIRSSFWTG